MKKCLCASYDLHGLNPKFCLSKHCKTYSRCEECYFSHDFVIQPNKVAQIWTPLTWMTNLWLVGLLYVNIQNSCIFKRGQYHYYLSNHPTSCMICSFSLCCWHYPRVQWLYTYPRNKIIVNFNFWKWLIWEGSTFSSLNVSKRKVH